MHGTGRSDPPVAVHIAVTPQLGPSREARSRTLPAHPGVSNGGTAHPSPATTAQTVGVLLLFTCASKAAHVAPTAAAAGARREGQGEVIALRTGCLDHLLPQSARTSPTRARSRRPPAGPMVEHAPTPIPAPVDAGNPQVRGRLPPGWPPWPRTPPRPRGVPRPRGPLAITVLISTTVPVLIRVVDERTTHAFPQTSRVLLSARLKCAQTQTAYDGAMASFCPVEPKIRESRWSRRLCSEFALPGAISQRNRHTGHRA